MQRILSAMIAALATAAVLAPNACLAEGHRWGQGYIPNLPVITQDGKKLRFYDDVIKGKIVVLNFIYTDCPDICGLTTARMSQVEDKLGEAMGRDIFFVSLTVDPEHDTPAKLKEYANAFHVGPGWLFLTGKPDDIRAISAKFGQRTLDLAEHRQQVLLGNDVTGEWSRNSVLGDIERFVMDVRAQSPKLHEVVQAPPHDVTADTGFDLGNQPGQVLFKKMCAPCHTVGVGDRAGPDLRDVTLRRDRDWVSRFIMDPNRMRHEKDPLALELAAKYPGVVMPRLGITENDAADLIAYVEAQSARLDADQISTSGPKDNETIGGAFTLVDQNGKSVTDRDLLGKPTLVFFGFTHCPDVCPTTLFELSNRLQELEADADRLNVLFITVDPGRDTPEQLALYLSSFDPHISGLSGTPDQVDAAIKAYHVYARKVALSGGDYTMDHTASVFMMDSKGQYVGTLGRRDTDDQARAKLRRLLDAAHS